MVECSNCNGACCRYIRLPLRCTADVWRWLNLHHQVYVKGDSLFIMCSCKELDYASGRCKDYDNRPRMCKHAEVGGRECKYARELFKTVGLSGGLPQEPQ